ncbi:MAG: DUF4325 domain-containing protein [Spirochaetales bacterium]|nr:DUF4325 domain-containing protein [Spirochaetales bacterium]
MFMDLHARIISMIKQKGSLKTADIVEQTGFSRAYIHRILKELVDAGKITLIGKANRAHYVFKSTKDQDTRKPLQIHKILKNDGLAEDVILRKIKSETVIFDNIKGNISSIIDYTFTEMVNNAIEHSESDKIDLKMVKTPNDIQFTVTDWGIGIFKNIMHKKKLKSELEAIQDLLKGKETTASSKHSGEGIFFTSKIADNLIIKSFEKKLVFDNIIHDVYITNVKSFKGTQVVFSINSKSDNNLADLFSRFTDESFHFNKTIVRVKLYEQEVEYVSRSQARRILAGLDKFKTIELDFDNVATAGQAFADEIFRVWAHTHPEVTLVPKSANENIQFMINRAKIK